MSPSSKVDFETSSDGDNEIVHQSSEKNESSNNPSRIDNATQQPIDDLTFPYKLHMILSCNAFSNIIAWTPNGLSWEIIDKKAFEEQVIPIHFRHGKYASFKRQVSGWGFRRENKINAFNVYFHSLFKRDEPELLKKMRRIKQKRDVNITQIAQTHDSSKFPAQISVRGGTDDRKQITGNPFAASATPTQPNSTSAATLPGTIHHQQGLLPHLNQVYGNLATTDNFQEQIRNISHQTSIPSHAIQQISSLQEQLYPNSGTIPQSLLYQQYSSLIRDPNLTASSNANLNPVSIGSIQIPTSSQRAYLNTNVPDVHMNTNHLSPSSDISLPILALLSRDLHNEQRLQDDIRMAQLIMRNNALNVLINNHSHVAPALNQGLSQLVLPPTINSLTTASTSTQSIEASTLNLIQQAILSQNINRNTNSIVGIPNQNQPMSESDPTQPDPPDPNQR